MGEIEAGQVAPGSQEAPNHFYRKRKRGYYRAYENQKKPPYEVIKFIADLEMRSMMNGMATQMWGQVFAQELKRPDGLADLVSGDPLPPRWSGDAGDHIFDAMRYSVLCGKKDSTSKWRRLWKSVTDALSIKWIRSLAKRWSS